MSLDNFNYKSSNDEFIIRLISFDNNNYPVFNLFFNVKENIDKKIIYYDYNKWLIVDEYNTIEAFSRMPLKSKYLIPENWESFVISKYDNHSNYINLINSISFCYNEESLHKIYPIDKVFAFKYSKILKQKIKKLFMTLEKFYNKIFESENIIIPTEINDNIMMFIRPIDLL